MPSNNVQRYREALMMSKAELARKAGLCSLLSVPLFAKDKVLGAINIYTREQRSFSDDEVDFVKVVAGQAATAIENARLMSETLEMKRTLETRKLVERAKGLLQSKQGMTEPEAFKWIQRAAMDRRTTMKRVAEVVLETLDTPEKA